MNRREFLLSIPATFYLSGCNQPAAASPGGELMGASDMLGHRLRDGSLPSPSRSRHAHVAIVGAGVSGLSAAWILARAGIDDFAVLELEPEAGGNARAGQNAISAYPWGAHYLPIPTMESRATREMLAEFGILQGDPGALRPRYEERHLCHAPHERLYIKGLWQDGLLPHVGASQRDLDQFRRFEDLVRSYKARRDKQGRKAFAIPMALSSRDPELLALDRISLRDFLLAQKLDSIPLHWYADYSCRDDYGCTAAETSAWAGLHYFACRDGEAANAETGSVLTWPEGNAWITRRLEEKTGARLQTGAAVFRVEEKRHGVELDIFHVHENISERLTVDYVIWAAPLFALPRVLQACPADLSTAIGHLKHAPWLTANLTLRAAPANPSYGAPLAWDNVLYGTQSLGYVVATHQHLRASPGPTVLTYYRSLAEENPASARQRLLHTPWRIWADNILRELSAPHPDLPGLVQRIDIWRNGHAMVRPEVGLIWGEARARLLQPGHRLHLAHADLSGFSLFEEAQYHGVAAAERVLKSLGVRHASLQL